MSHKNKVSLVMQAKERFDSMQCFGRSKHDDKLAAVDAWEKSDKSMSKRDFINESIKDKIYSINTYGTYAKHNNYFFKWCEETLPKSECKTLDDVKKYVPQWLEIRKEQGLSAYTLKTEAAGLGKLYQCDYRDFGVKLPERRRDDIFRSRDWGAKKEFFSEEKNREIVDFCRGTGLRRSELAVLTPDALVQRDGEYYLHVRGKGGRWRYAPIIGAKDAIINRIENTEKGCLVWPSVPEHMDTHGYRAEYATAIYDANARDIKDIPFDYYHAGIGNWVQSDVYKCRGDRAGEKFDKQAMRIASNALGHGRISVIAANYLRH